MSKKGSFAFASVIAALVLASWIERATPKAVNRDSASAEKTIRDFSLTGRQHFGVPSSNLRMSGLFDKYPFDEHMEKLREKAGRRYCVQLRLTVFVWMPHCTLPRVQREDYGNL